MKPCASMQKGREQQAQARTIAIIALAFIGFLSLSVETHRTKKLYHGIDSCIMGFLGRTMSVRAFL
ncbi:MAG: hypothetical protein P8Y80_02155, partial [Acidobacteriota bacterium]